MIGTKAQQIQNLLMNLNNTGKSCWGMKMHNRNNLYLLFWLLLLGTTQTKHTSMMDSRVLHSCTHLNLRQAMNAVAYRGVFFICLCFFVFAFVCVFASLLHSFALESLHAIWPNTVVNGFLPPPKASKDADYWTPWMKWEKLHFWELWLLERTKFWQYQNFRRFFLTIQHPLYIMSMDQKMSQCIFF